MVTCPWCGTNYAEFRSNCQNCGGPLAPPEAPAARADDELPAPPPPQPRTIAQSFVWRLLLSDGWAITAFILGLIGAIFIAVGASLTVAVVTAVVGLPFFLLGIVMLVPSAGVLVWRYRHSEQTANVLRQGEAIRGQIVSAETNYAVTINGRNPWAIAYRFELAGREYLGRVSTLNDPGPRLQPGRAAWVLYLPGAPDSNSLYPHP